MDSDRAELNALANSLEDLTRRITAVADRLRGTPRSDVASGLYEAERSLISASRQVERVVRSM
ncbi:MAG: hypothetical protein ACLFXM_12540 [Acidimicrobiia bacterium]